MYVFEDLPADAQERIKKVNFAYMEVLPYMKRRVLKGEGNRWSGVEWYDENNENRVLFSLEHMEWEVPQGAAVTNVQEGTVFIASEGVVHTLPWQVCIWQ